MKYSLQITFYLVFVLNLNAFEDNDFDGVDDQFDKCLNTPCMDLVNQDGCSIQSLVNHHKLSLNLGVALSQKDITTLQDDSTIYSSLEINYNYKALNLYIVASQYENDSGSGLNDTLLGVSYQFSFSNNFMLRPSLTLYLPSYETGFDNEKADFGGELEMNYVYDNFLILGSYSYTIENNSNIIIDTEIIHYQNHASFQVGFGYFFETTYTDIRYLNATSIYNNVEDLENISFSLQHYFNDSYAVLTDYAYGLSKSTSKHYLSLRFSYRF